MTTIQATPSAPGQWGYTFTHQGRVIGADPFPSREAAWSEGLRALREVDTDTAVTFA